MDWLSFHRSEPHRLAQISKQRNMPFSGDVRCGFGKFPVIKVCNQSITFSSSWVPICGCAATAKLLSFVVAKVTMASRDHDVVLVQGGLQALYTGWSFPDRWSGISSGDDAEARESAIHDFCDSCFLIGPLLGTWRTKVTKASSARLRHFPDVGLEVANGVSATVPCSKALKLYSTEFQGAISFRNWIDLAPVFPVRQWRPCTLPCEGYSRSSRGSHCQSSGWCWHFLKFLDDFKLCWPLMRACLAWSIPNQTR